DTCAAPVKARGCGDAAAGGSVASPVWAGTRRAVMPGTLTSKRFKVDDMAAAVDFCFDRGWSDGLPVVPPTESAVRAMLDAVRLARESHDRARGAPGHAQRVRLDARLARPRHRRPSRQALVRDRRERGGEPVDAAARRARLSARAVDGHRDGGGGPAPVLQPAL